MLLGVLLKRFRVPVPVVWKSFNCGARVRARVHGGGRARWRVGGWLHRPAG